MDIPTTNPGNTNYYQDEDNQQTGQMPPLPYSVSEDMITNNAGNVPPEILAAVISSETNGYNLGQAGYVPGELPPGGIGQMSLGEVADTYKRLMDQGADSETMAKLDDIISRNIHPDLPAVLKKRSSDDPLEAQQGEAEFHKLWPEISADLAASGGNVMLEGQDAVDMVSLSLASLKNMDGVSWDGALTMYNAGVTGGAGLGDPAYLDKIHALM